jgi:hypothetical protein
MKHYVVQTAVILTVGLATTFVVERWLDGPIHFAVCHYLIGPC